MRTHLTPLGRRRRAELPSGAGSMGASGMWVVGKLVRCFKHRTCGLFVVLVVGWGGVGWVGWGGATSWFFRFFLLLRFWWQHLHGGFFLFGRTMMRWTHAGSGLLKCRSGRSRVVRGSCRLEASSTSWTRPFDEWTVFVAIPVHTSNGLWQQAVSKPSSGPLTLRLTWPC